MGFFRFFIITFIITFISIKIFKLIYDEKFIKDKFKKDIILSILSIFFILIYLWSIRVDDLSFYKTSFLDSYFSYDEFLSSLKILVYTGMIIFISTSTTSFIYNVFYKNKLFYYVSNVFLYFLLYFIILKSNIISFDIKEPSYFFNLLPPIGFRVKCGIILGISLAYIIDFINGRKKKSLVSKVNNQNDDEFLENAKKDSNNTNSKKINELKNNLIFFIDKYHIKYISIIVLFLIILINQFRITTSLYPTYMYEKALNNQFKKLLQNDDKAKSNISKNDNKNNSEDKNNNEYIDKTKLKNLRYDEIKIGDTVSFGRRKVGGVYKDIEWIVLDKKKNENEVLLLSKYGLDVVNNFALENKVTDYEYYDIDYDTAYKYDLSSPDEFDYNNSALRYAMYHCYEDFLEYYLSKDINKEYNEYDYKDNIVDTYLEDTKTYEKFFPLSKDEYNKYKKMEGVGNFYFENSDRYIIFREQFSNIIYTLRTFKAKSNEKGENYEYDFLCVDTPYDALTFEKNEELIKNSNNIIGETFWFHDRFTADFEDENYNERTANDLYHGFIDVVLRPAMWYKCDE